MDVLIGWPGGSWETTARLFGTVFFSYIALLWLASVLWVYRDIRSRSADIVVHVIAVAIVLFFPLVGLPVYLILRPSETLNDSFDRRLEQDALLSELHAMDVCPNCQYPVGEDFSVCANCGAAVRQACTRCNRPLQMQWRHCPYCATPRPQAYQQQRAAESRAEARVTPSQPRPARETPREAPRAARPDAHEDAQPEATPRPGRQAALDAIRRAAARASAEISPDRHDPAAEPPAQAPAPRPANRPRATDEADR